MFIFLMNFKLKIEIKDFMSSNLDATLSYNLKRMTT